MSTIKIKREFLPDDLGGGGGYANVGTIVEWPSDTIPENWLLCDGRAVSRNTYSDLFAVIGTQFGAGDGSTTFNLPNREGRSPIGKDPNDTDFDTIGKKYGEKVHTLTTSELPNIQGTLPHTAFGESKLSGVFSIESAGVVNYEGSAGNTQNNNRYKMNFGSNQAHNTVHPVEVSNFIIKASAEASTSGTIVDSLSGDSTTDAPSVHIVKDALSNKLDTSAVKTSSTTSDTDTYGCNYINNYINGSHIAREELLNNAVEVINSGTSATGNLNKSVGNYDMLIVLVRGDWNHLKTIVIPVGVHGYAYDCYLYSDSQYYFSGYLNCPSNTTIKITKDGGAFGCTIMQVYGIKFK